MNNIDRHTRVNGKVDSRETHVHSSGPDLGNDSLRLRPLIVRFCVVPLIQGRSGPIYEILLFA